MIYYAVAALLALSTASYVAALMDDLFSNTPVWAKCAVCSVVLALVVYLAERLKGR